MFLDNFHCGFVAKMIEIGLLDHEKLNNKSKGLSKIKKRLSKRVTEMDVAGIGRKNARFDRCRSAISHIDRLCGARKKTKQTMSEHEIYVEAFFWACKESMSMDMYRSISITAANKTGNKNIISKVEERFKAKSVEVK